MKKICENCSEEHDGSYGSGRFCSSKCSRGFSTKNKRKKINENVSISLKKRWENMSDECKKEHAERCKHEQTKETKKKISEKNKLYWKDNHEAKQRLSNFRKGKKTSEETKKKLSDIMKKRVKEGKHKGWQSRNIKSYSEKFFVNVLKENGLDDYIFNFPIKKKSLGIDCNANYFLDFFFENKKLDLEIDGKQHEISERKKMMKFVMNI
jgi:very-short-patch-repair endonuclease